MCGDRVPAGEVESAGGDGGDGCTTLAVLCPGSSDDGGGWVTCVLQQRSSKRLLWTLTAGTEARGLQQGEDPVLGISDVRGGGPRPGTATGTHGPSAGRSCCT